MVIETESGSYYQVSADNKRIRRLNTKGRELRRDEEWIELQAPIEPVIGEGMFLVLEPLGEGIATIRKTTKVKNIWYTGELTAMFEDGESNGEHST